jgi:hypothetical protein
VGRYDLCSTIDSLDYPLSHKKDWATNKVKVLRGRRGIEVRSSLVEVATCTDIGVKDVESIAGL